MLAVGLHKIGRLQLETDIRSTENVPEIRRINGPVTSDGFRLAVSVSIIPMISFPTVVRVWTIFKLLL